MGGAYEVGSLTDEQGASMIQLLLEDTVSDAQDRRLVEEMANQLCGLPLALAQMAGYLRSNHVTVNEFLGDYKNREYVRTLLGSAKSLDHQQYQHTLKTVWRLSFEKLSADAQTLLRVAVFLHPDGMPNQLFQIPQTPSGTTLPSALQVLDKSHNRFRYNAARSSLTQQFLMKYDNKVCLRLAGASFRIQLTPCHRSFRCLFIDKFNRVLSMNSLMAILETSKQLYLGQSRSCIMLTPGNPL